MSNETNPHPRGTAAWLTVEVKRLERENAEAVSALVTADRECARLAGRLAAERDDLRARLAAAEQRAREAEARTETVRSLLAKRGDDFADGLIEATARAEKAEAERDEARRTVDAVRATLSGAGFCGDGNLPDMVARALGESLDRGRSEGAHLSAALLDASAEFPRDMTGTVAERVRALRSDLDAAIARATAAEGREAALGTALAWACEVVPVDGMEEFAMFLDVPYAARRAMAIRDWLAERLRRRFRDLLAAQAPTDATEGGE